MNPYRDLDAAYEQLARRPTHQTIAHDVCGDLDSIVATIRDDSPVSGPSDHMLRSLIVAGRATPDPLTVVLYALAPELRTRLSRLATIEYHADALGDLTFVILESDLDRPGLARRLVNRAHNRAWRNALRVRTRGVLNVTTVVPCPPDQLTYIQARRLGTIVDVADAVVDRVDLERFRAALENAVTARLISPAVWATYRNHYLRRAITTTSASTSQERVAAHRAARRLAPYIQSHLGLDGA